MNEKNFSFSLLSFRFDSSFCPFCFWLSLHFFFSFFSFSFFLSFFSLAFFSLPLLSTPLLDIYFMTFSIQLFSVLFFFTLCFLRCERVRSAFRFLVLWIYSHISIREFVWLPISLCHSRRLKKNGCDVRDVLMHASRMHYTTCDTSHDDKSIRRINS